MTNQNAIYVMTEAMEALVLADRDSGMYSFDIEIAALRTAIAKAESQENASYVDVMQEAIEALELADRDSGVYSFDVEIAGLRDAIAQA